MANLRFMLFVQAFMEACFVIDYVSWSNLCNVAIFLAALTFMTALGGFGEEPFKIRLRGIRKLWDEKKPLVAVCLLQVIVVVAVLVTSGEPFQMVWGPILLAVPVLSIALAGYCKKDEVKSRS